MIAEELADNAMDFCAAMFTPAFVELMSVPFMDPKYAVPLAVTLTSSAFASNERLSELKDRLLRVNEFSELQEFRQLCLGMHFPLQFVNFPTGCTIAHAETCPQVPRGTH